MFKTLGRLVKSTVRFNENIIQIANFQSLISSVNDCSRTTPAVSSSLNICVLKSDLSACRSESSVFVLHTQFLPATWTTENWQRKKYEKINSNEQRFNCFGLLNRLPLDQILLLYCFIHLMKCGRSLKFLTVKDFFLQIFKTLRRHLNLKLWNP